MHGHGFLADALVFLIAAVIAVPLFRRLGLGAVLGYLAAGVVIGPHVLGFISDPESVLTASEFGVVMLLFIIGLELSPARLWVMRRQVFGIGSLQVGVSAALIGGAIALWGLGWKASLVVGLGLALSSTAVGLQLLAERKALTADYGRIAFAVLLFQDAVAIPLLALIPLLGEAKAAEQAAPGLDAVLKAVGVILAIVIGGRYLLRPLFRIVARAQAVEVFTASALMVVAGSAFLVQQAGLSMALGAFLAGVLLAESEFRHELESHIEPFKGLLLGLFFMAVGMSIDLGVIVAEPGQVVIGTLALLAIKFAVLWVVGRQAAKLKAGAPLQLAAVLAMGGEFAFVVFSEAGKAGLLAPAESSLLVVIVGMSMAATPLLLMAVDAHCRKLAKIRERAPAFDAIDDHDPKVIIAGFGRMGQMIGRMLRAQHIPFTALENSPQQVELSRRFGSTLYFGDPSRAELLRAARADRAEILVLTTDDPEANIRTARMIKRLYPHLKVFARARNRQHAFRLMDLNIEGITRETFPAALEMARSVLLALGQDAAVVESRLRTFREHDEALLREQHLVYDDETALVQSAREAFTDLERLFEADAASERERERGGQG
ncbi:MAG: cation:proton antiporter [Xanthomonadales bacterium]|nr:cation:proton antiporter [Xanthomonadales bacterium]